jgi:predicted  nucleic acid-binding Zn-ribbon protein
MNLEAFSPYIVGLVSALSAWYLGQQKQRSEIVEKSRQLTMSEMEWVKTQTEKRFADLITERDYYRQRVAALDTLLDTEREQAKTSRLSLEQTVSALSQTCEQQRQEINQLEEIITQQRKEIDRLNFVIGG